MSLLRTLIAVDWKLLARDRVALLLSFALPPVFFAIFATIFGGMSGGEDGELRPLRVIAIDGDGSDVSARLLERLFALPAVARAEIDGEDARDLERATAAVREGEADAAILVEPGFEAAFARFWETPPRVRLVHDAANPMARFTLEGLLQAATFQAAPMSLMESGLGALEELGGGITPEQRSAIEALRSLVEHEPDGDTGGSAAPPAGFVSIESTAATERAGGAAGPSIVDYYAAAIGVMFLLFSMSGAASSLLEEEERGTLERLLMTGTGIGQVLCGHWAFFALAGSAQLGVMFVFGWLAFDLALADVQVIAGLALVGAVTAAAASAFALCLAAACRTRAQLAGLSTILILVMSALGGSMVPRFVMPPFMDTVSRFTFNGWALDGFLAVLWERDEDGSLAALLGSIALPVLVLSLATAAFLLGARRLARRWETI